MIRSIAALLLLNGLLSFENWWPTPAILPDWRLAPEFVVLWVVLGAIVLFGRGLGDRTLALVAVFYVLLIIGRYFDVTVPALFGRPINLYWDGYQLPIVLSVLARKVPVWLPPLLVLILIVLTWGVYRITRWAIAVTGRQTLPAVMASRWAWALTTAALVLVGFNQAGYVATWPYVSKPVTPVYARQTWLLTLAFSPRAAHAALPGSPEFLRSAAGLDGADVTVLFLESYGATVFDEPQSHRELAPARARLAQAISESGRRVVSGFVRSPTFAGGSELAHLGLLSGLDLSDPFRHDLLLTTDRPTLISYFRHNGYETFGMYPALSWDWAEKRYYGFDVFLDARDLTYRGPHFGAWYVPDQYSIARFDAMYPITADSRPRLLFFPSINSHIPFAPVPPYQPDWSRLLSDDPFDRHEVQAAISYKPDWLDLVPDYRRSIAYNFDWLAGYLRLPRKRETVYLILGDHQPAASVSGPGAPWDVPVHIVTSNSRLIERLKSKGWREGVEPQRPLIGEMHELTGQLLELFSDGTASR